jgi:hypothetical protein
MRIDGELVTDLDTAPVGTRVLVWGGWVSAVRARCPDAGLPQGVAADLDCKPQHAGLLQEA